ncbi:hypothetical protein [uncultured Roseobacter sp.]|uniref:hypothetical protein n=1 Tax=uncultured Roseobacter sp. TaxID=114847 RepID=UPI00345D44E0
MEWIGDKIAQRELICALSKSTFERELTGGSAGNLTARTDDGDLPVWAHRHQFWTTWPGTVVALWTARVKSSN